MSDLIARLEAATEPSRELDAEICKAVGYVVKNHRGYGVYYEPVKGESWQDVPLYTSSIDAALSLAPDNDKYCNAGLRAGILHAACWQQRIGDIPAWRIPILVTIAALKAREPKP